MAMAEPRIEDLEEARAEWLDQLRGLVALVRGWVESSGWRTRQTTKPVNEPELGRYEVPLLLIERDEVEIVLSPVPRTSAGGGGVVALCMMPAYDDLVSLSLDDGQWFIQAPCSPDPSAPGFWTESERLPLDDESLNRILDAVATRA